MPKKIGKVRRTLSRHGIKVPKEKSLTYWHYLIYSRIKRGGSVFTKAQREK